MTRIHVKNFVGFDKKKFFKWLRDTDHQPYGKGHLMKRNIENSVVLHYKLEY